MAQPVWAKKPGLLRKKVQAFLTFLSQGQDSCPQPEIINGKLHIDNVSLCLVGWKNKDVW